MAQNPRQRYVSVDGFDYPISDAFADEFGYTGATGATGAGTTLLNTLRNTSYDNYLTNEYAPKSGFSSAISNPLKNTSYDNYLTSGYRQPKSSTGGATGAGKAKLKKAYADLSKGGDKLAGMAGDAITGVMNGQGIAPKYSGLIKTGLALNAISKGAQGFSQYNNAKNNREDLISDILASAGSNSNLSYDLTADQLRTLQQLQNGTYDTGGGVGDIFQNIGKGLGNNIGGIASGALMGYLTGGGTTGAILGGLGSAIEGVSNSAVNDLERNTTELQSLYQTLYEAEMRNKQMRREAAQQRYGGYY